MQGEWRNWTFSEYAKFQLENVFALCEHLLCEKLGYTTDNLCDIFSELILPMLEVVVIGLMIPSRLSCTFGGLSNINLLSGNTVIVALATGRLGGSAVMVALAMGATVFACGRNEGTLVALRKTHGDTGKLETVKSTGDQGIDTKEISAASGSGVKGADAYIDFSPNEAANSTFQRRWPH